MNRQRVEGWIRLMNQSEILSMDRESEGEAEEVERNRVEWARGIWVAGTLPFSTLPI